MFKAPNPYEDLVAKATDEGLTGENWQLNLDLCDKLSDDDENNARSMIAAVRGRLTHKNTNVQLYALTLADTLSKNCGNAVHHEIASRAFMQTMSKLATDRTTHALTKKRVLALLREWAEEYKADDTLSLVAETVRDLKAEYFDVDDDDVTTSNADAAERLRREDEELQRVLALSVQDQGGRGAFMNNAGGSSTRASDVQAAPPIQETPAAPAPAQSAAPPAAQPAAAPAAAPATAPAAAAPQARPSFVRALYDFEPDEPGELAFSAGDVIRVLDSVYEQWWRGELRQDVGIFPVNYVEPMPEMAQAAIEQDLEMEQSVFAHAADIHLLHARLQQLDPVRDNFVDDDELQDLYQRSLSLRPKIIRLMDRYSVKVQELRAMNDKFMRARSTFEDLISQRMEQYAHDRHEHGVGEGEGKFAQAEPPLADHAAPALQATYAAHGATHAPLGAYDAAPARSDAYAETQGSSAYAQGSSQQGTAQAPPYGSYAGYASNPPGHLSAEEEKRRLFEQAKAEVDAYHQAYHQQPVQRNDTAESLAGLHLS